MIYELNPRLARFQICLTMVVVVVYNIPSIFKVMHKSYERVDDVVSKLITLRTTQIHLESGRLGILPSQRRER